MHNAAIIIKPKDLSVEEARIIFGDYLVKVEEADAYRERLFANDKRVISVKEFITEFKSKWITEKLSSEGAWPIGILEEYWVDNKIIPYGFWEFYSVGSDLQGRLNELYLEGYMAWFDRYVGSMDDKENYEVVLLDYHN